MYATIVGHDTTFGFGSKLKGHRVLLLPDPNQNIRGETVPAKAFWATVSADGGIAYTEEKKYELSFHSYGKYSPAHDACLEILEHVKCHSKAGPFMEPVDYVALDIPTYPEVIKRPMDLGTMAKKLDSGEYGNLPPPQASDSAAVDAIRIMVYGLFLSDLCLIFDNCMAFNHEKDWIYKQAAVLKKAALKKVDLIANKAMREASRSKTAKAAKSVYVDDDSDVDMYEYESDQDDDAYGSSRRSRVQKRVKKVKEEDNVTRSIEVPIRLPRVDKANVGDDIFSSLPISSDAELFSMPSGCSVEHSRPEEVMTDGDALETDKKEEDEFAKQEKADMERLEMLEMALMSNQPLVRRSSRAATVASSEAAADRDNVSAGNASSVQNVEYHLPDGSRSTSRAKLETALEAMHEATYAQLFFRHFAGQSHGGVCTATNVSTNPGATRPSSNIDDAEGFASTVGTFADDSFPPYLGRIVPVTTGVASDLSGPSRDGMALIDNANVVWEIREPFLGAAIRWVIRGLVRSGHLSEVEPMDGTSGDLRGPEKVDSSGVVIASNAYCRDASNVPYDVLDVREMMRKRRMERQAEEESSSEEEVEMSAYEKMRLERVKRNEERLKALGLTS